MDTKIAFLNPILSLVEMDGVIGASFDTYLASVTGILVQYNRPVISFFNRFQRTGIDTGRMLTMIAQKRQEVQGQIRKATRGRVLLERVLSLHLNQALGGFVFDLAGHGTGVTSDAALLVND